MIYSDITQTALLYADRVGDPEAVDRMPFFFRIVESRINRLLDNVINSEITTVTAYTNTPPALDSVFILPTDFNGLRDIYIVNDSTNKRVTLEHISPIQINNANYNSSGNKYYNIQNQNINVYPGIAEQQSLVYTYKQKLLPLDDVNVSNFISNNYPDCYVFGLMVELSSFTKDGPATTMWDERFRSSVQEVEDKESKNKWSGTPLVTRVI